MKVAITGNSSGYGRAMMVLLAAVYFSNCCHAFVAPTSFSKSTPVGLPSLGRSASCVPRLQDRQSFPLRQSNGDNNNKSDDGEASPLSENIRSSLSKLRPLQDLLVKISSMIPWKGIATGVVSFSVGAVFAISALLWPVYQSQQFIAQSNGYEPVTLFETILNDLDRGYVDPVDTNKLFETGISAMLQSLDPYTEFEAKQEAQDLTETIQGKYGGVGLVISGRATPKTTTSPSLLPQNAVDDNAVETQYLPNEQEDALLDDEDEDKEERFFRRRQETKMSEKGIQVVQAFEGYAFDYGLRVGDKLVGIDDFDITPTTTVDQVRNSLRGEPGTMVNIRFERQGLDGVQQVVMPRTVVRLRDVKLATMVGPPSDGIGYVQLSGFSANAGAELKQAMLYLQTVSQQHGNDSLKGLILDLRGNPGGLLTSAVDVSSLLVPKGSDIVSARGRGFSGVLYKSKVDPLLADTKLAVLINGGTASAAEIVSGAVQDLDAGVIVGADRTFGKGLVQNVEDLPYDTALKFTVAKYYTPSGRCIQGVNYKEGNKGSKYLAEKVKDKDRAVYYTRLGREVRDGGGIEADYKVEAPKASALEVTLLRSGVFADFAAQWSQKHELTSNFEVGEDTFKEFQAFVNEKQKNGDIKLEALYNSPLKDLKKALKQSGYSGASKELEHLQMSIVREVQNDFNKYRADIKEDIAQSILARYLPESMLLERSLKDDRQVIAATKLLRNRGEFDTLLAKGSSNERTMGAASSLNVAKAETRSQEESIRLNIEW